MSFEVGEALLQPVEEALKGRHRRLIVLAGENGESYAAKIFTYYAKAIGRPVRLLFAADSLDEDTSYGVFTRKIRELNLRGVKVEGLLYKDSEEILGATYDGLILDLKEQLRPNDLGRLIELVAGGGIIVALTPRLDEWRQTITRFHRKLIVPPYEEKDLNHRFIRRLLKTLNRHPGIWVFEDGKLVHGEPVTPPLGLPEKTEPPENSRFPPQLYRLTLTSDQVEALYGFEHLIPPPKGGSRRVLVLTANRGRGKSAALGLGATGLLYTLGGRDRKARIEVTAPNFSSVRVVLEFAAKGLKALGFEPEPVKVKGETVALTCKLGVIDSVSPYRVLRRDADVVLVDEAAGIPVPLLFRILKAFRKAVYSSTIHGYEGAGRGFGLRFMEALERSREVNLKRVELTTPIRYGAGDPVEAWLYDALLLDAEPSPLTHDELLGLSPEDCQYITPDLDRWFLEDDEPLRRFIGIYVLAHYRNRPDDLAILGDAPHHMARALITAKGKIVAALHLAQEGSMPRELIEEVASGGNPPGNIIPSCIAKNYVPFRHFARLKGIRVVRIAVHPELRGRKLGSKALAEVEKEAEALGFDWVGSGFGASEELLRFWIRNGFIPLYMSPARNLVSGEFSVLVVKPISPRAAKLVQTINFEFRLRLLESLHDTYFTLEPRIAQLLLRGISEPYRAPLNLTKTQMCLLAAYAAGKITYEMASAAVRGLLKTHFLSSGEKRCRLPANLEAALIAKCFQGRSWKSSVSLSDFHHPTVRQAFREAIREVFLYYGGEEASHLLQRIQG